MLVQGFKFVLLQGGDDEADGVGAGDGGFVDLHLVQHEILAQAGQPDSSTDFSSDS